jgi:hypothetical protein
MQHAPEMARHVLRSLRCDAQPSPAAHQAGRHTLRHTFLVFFTLPDFDHLCPLKNRVNSLGRPYSRQRFFFQLPRDMCPLDVRPGTAEALRCEKAREHLLDAHRRNGSEQWRVWFILSMKINHLSGEVKTVSALCILDKNRSF